METRLRGAAKTLFPTGGMGVLFPPGVLTHTPEDREAALTLCPHGDDIWLWWIAIRNRATFRTVGRYRRNLPWWGSEHCGLWRHNLSGGGNDDQIRRMTDRYGFPLASND